MTMKICMFTNTYLPHVGGVARSVKTFATDLEKKGHHILIVAPVFPGHEAEDRNQNNILRVPAVQQFNGSDFSVRIPIPFFIDETINNFDPQIIHSHHPYLLGDAALRLSRRRNLPLIFTHHTLYEAYVHHLNVKSDTLQQFAAHLSTEYANLCDRVIAPSQSIADLLNQRGITSPVDIIPTGVDRQFFSEGNKSKFRKTHGIDESAFVIGHLGRLASEKNLEYLANSVCKTIENFPKTLFLVAGDGPCKKQIAQIFKDRGIEKKLIMPGNVTGQEVADAYHAMDLFIFSSHTETQGMVLTEAMAAGLPVIALDAPGVREVIEHNKNGLLLHHNTSMEEFSAAISKAVENDTVLKKWRVNALNTAEQFSRECSADKLERLYTSMTTTDATHTTEKRGQSLEPWETLLNGLQAEWDLMVQKAKSVVETLQEPSPTINNSTDSKHQ